MENNKNAFNVDPNKSVLNVEAQKELINHSFNQSFKLMLKMFLIIVPVMLIFVFGGIYLVTKILK